MTGFSERSRLLSKSSQLGGCSSWPNSVMSAPEKKLDPRQMTMPALIAGSRAISTMPLCRPALTDWLMALTGGLSVHSRATSPRRSRDTVFESSVVVIRVSVLAPPSGRRSLQVPIALVQLALVGEGERHHGQALEVMTHVQVVGHAHAAMDLDGLLADQARGLVDLELDHDRDLRIDRGVE